MSVGKAVIDAIAKMEAGEPDRALFQLCAAVDDTATRQYGCRGRSSFKRFIAENFALVTDVAFGLTVIGTLRVKFDHPDLEDVRGHDGLVCASDLFYHVVRCELYHTTALPANLVFSPYPRIVVVDGRLELPAALITGLIVAVVVAPVNGACRAPREATISFGANASAPLSSLWGQCDKLRNLLARRTGATRLHQHRSGAAPIV